MCILRKPILQSPLPTISKPLIGIVGGLGNIVKVLLAEFSDCVRKFDVIVFAADNKSHLKLKLFFDDLGVSENIKASSSLKEVLACEILLFCAGINTREITGTYKKEQIFEKNKLIVESILGTKVKSKVILLVTNPTTKLLPYVSKLSDTYTIGVGLTNDYLRWKNTNNKGEYIVGGHNFYDFAVGSINKEGCSDFIYTKKAYEQLSKQEDSFLEKAYYGKLIKYLDGLDENVYWWASQRLNTIFHKTNYSCVKAIIKIIEFLTDSLSHKEKSMVIETKYHFADINKTTVIGWPIDYKTRTPIPLYFNEEPNNMLDVVINKYSVN